MTSNAHGFSSARHALPGFLLVAAAGLAACAGGAPAGSAYANRSDPPGGPAPTATPNATMAGPTSLSAWTDRQGYGGGSGIAEVQKGADWLHRNTGAPDRASWTDWWSSLTDGLVFWLDTHPATDCWAAYHEAVTQALGHIQDEFRPIRAAVNAGANVPGAPISDMLDAANALVALEQPADCP